MSGLLTIKFSDISIWDVKNYFRQVDVFNEKYPLALFGEFLKKPNIEKIKIEDEKEYTILGVRSYGKGVYENRTVKGNTLKMRTYQLAKKDHLFWCKVDTKNGAFGIIDEKLEKGIASSNMTFAEINKNIANTEFIQILFKSKKVNQYMDGYVTGTTNRKYIKPNQLLEEIKVPLPSLQEQNRIVANYNSKIALATQQEAKADDLINEIEAYQYKSLGLIRERKKKRKSGLLDTISFKEVDRWAVDSLGRVVKIENKFKGKYPLVKLRELILSTQYGLSEKSSKEPIGIPMLRMNNINNAKLDLNSLKYITIEESVFKKYKLNKGDLLFNRTNSKELVGKTALFFDDEDYTFASYLIRVVIDEQRANKEYINYLFNSSILQYQKDLVSRQITGQANINAQEMQDFLFPLPPLKVQEKIANDISKKEQQIIQLLAQAENNREEALKEFEQEIFSS